MVLDNYVKLQPGIPKRLHFTSHAIVDNDITDKLTGLVIKKTQLMFVVDREDGLAVSKTFSTLAERLAVQLLPDLENKDYINKEYVITMFGTGYQTRYSLDVRPF